MGIRSAQLSDSRARLLAGNGIVAESVADEETIGLLQKHHVDYAQGFYVGKPAPLDVAMAESGWLSQSSGHTV